MPTLLDRIHTRTRPQPYRSDGQPEADFELWEDGDDIPVPKVSLDANDGEDDGFGPASQTDDYGNVPNANPTSFDRYRGAIEKKAAWDQTRPNISDHKPKLWQRLLAGAAGGAAGYVNAGGRVKVDPKAMQSINDSLMRPGYQRDMEAWSDQAGKIGAEVDSLGREVQMDTQQQRARLDAERATAYGKSQDANVKYREKQMAELDKDKWIIDPQGHFEINSRTRERRVLNVPKAPPTPKETESEKADRMLKYSREVLKHKEGSDDQLAYLGDPAAKERIRAANRPARGSGSGKPRVGTPGQMDKLEDQTSKEYEKAEKEAIKALAAADLADFEAENPWESHGNPDNAKKIERIKETLRVRKNQIARKYDVRGKNLGGQVRDGGGDAYSRPKTPPKAGDVKDGYRFKGGNPADQNSWEKVN